MRKIRCISDLANMKNDLKSKKSSEELVIIKVAMATCSIAAGAKEVMDVLTESISRKGIKNVIVEKTGCMGYCYAEPTIKVIKAGEEVVFGNVDKHLAKNIVDEYIENKSEIEGVLTDKDNKQMKIVLRNCGSIDPESINDYICVDGYEALGKVLFDLDPDKVIEEIKKSGLRGRGGGGFPTGVKWEYARKSKSDKKYVICNADEGDPGAFMDRSILEGDPHSIVEAMIICGYAIGADEGKVYIRAEYPLAIKRLQKAIDDAREYGLLGKNIMGSEFDFDIEIKYGAGAFVCGEETALIHSIEGERGEPTTKPPFPAESGLWGKPTNVNNVETFANIPVIILNGSDWFNKIGTERSKGTKVFALAGKVKNVGLIEVAMGTTLREVIFDIGGGIVGDKKFKAVQTGGPSGGCLTENDLDTPIDFESLVSRGSMMGSGGMIVMDEEDCMPSVAKFYLEFIQDESCGKCTPCRIGTKRLWEVLEKITTGKSTIEDLEQLKVLSEVIKDTALCGLGQTAPNPVLSTLNTFLDEYEDHVKYGKCTAGKCNALLKYRIIKSKCVGCGVCSKVCPTSAISGRLKQAHVIDQIKCIKCGACMDKCKFYAIKKD
ncbi:NAD(P)-dependent iron-only hydrogenase diaphorase component flavoprotein [Alkalithermobacter thermoalcaliphilus JW-YL-7 = DSM 7308]|uniref:NAD(P)-dependent iron-only hydrogenase diaphorase component flavoprotein n=1 Tax=Alkalithermobacter thermoalcaliphilus JW-YL-7 = DSM 7308 TaxID=1121328 RepID=A0A150FS01_CLOPD|nr:NADH dehydrogenase (quinone) [[Clostridium] paradoxum JW-YL-7 = DSM 7308]SHK35510.1 NAD(P)-dependent iron-only hydrogenase diaphorase component flavoprotein [[Clostridium] paradoxum JW-YL-7 = DSM 7308]